MPKINRSDKNKIDKIFKMSDGYLLDFSNKSLADFFEDELNIDIEDKKYETEGTSKAKRFRRFIEVEDSYTVKIALELLYKYKVEKYGNDPQEEVIIKDIIQRISAGINTNISSALYQKAEILNLETVNRDLERALKDTSNDPESAITSACSTLESVCRSIIKDVGMELPPNKDIKGLYNSVKKALKLSSDNYHENLEIQNDVLTLLSGLSAVVNGIGALRTHGGDAHGRESGYTRLDSRTAKLAVNCANSLSLYLIETWESQYPSRKLIKIS